MEKLMMILSAMTLLCLAGGALFAQNAGRAEWMAGRYGMMTHWFVYPEGDTPEEKTENFNKRVDAFDLDGYMKQFDESGASWLIFTLCQNNGYWNTRCSYLEKYLPGHYPQRDLALEIAKKVKARGKRFVLYIAGSPVDFPHFSPEAAAAFGWEPGTDISESPEFEGRWLEYIVSLSKHFGALCDGWWIDGLYPNVHKGKWHFDKWLAAFRSGNPQSAVALSDAGFCVGNLTNLCPGNDYFAGETHLIENGYIRIDPVIGSAESYGEGKRFHLENGKVRATGKRPEFFAPAAQFIDGVQLHALMALDLPFSPMPAEWVSYPKEELLKLAQNMKNARGGLSVNVPIEGNGHIPQGSIDKLRYLKENLK
ncbi:MAG: alpha-L-fucosidase [Abditibacteriota bacterium]|nr:alpha-L-fucosidase [Abditibacteriota bacterium]